jgi:hypothetical protein
MQLARLEPESAPVEKPVVPSGGKLLQAYEGLKR